MSRAPSIDRVTDLVLHFERLIVSGQLAAGDLLPAERAISAERGVSRSVVREAISRLASLGLVRSVHGSGTRVQEPSSRPITQGYQRLLRQGEIDLVQLTQVRMPLETTLAALAARHRGDEQLARMDRAQEALRHPRATLDAQVRADLEFHAVLAEASGNPFFGLVLAPMQELLIESRRRTLGRHGAVLAHDHHAAILDAVRLRDEAAAAAAMRHHLEKNMQHLAGERAPTRNGTSERCSGV